MNKTKSLSSLDTSPSTSRSIPPSSCASIESSSENCASASGDNPKAQYSFYPHSRLPQAKNEYENSDVKIRDSCSDFSTPPETRDTYVTIFEFTFRHIFIYAFGAPGSSLFLPLLIGFLIDNKHTINYATICGVSTITKTLFTALKLHINISCSIFQIVNISRLGKVLNLTKSEFGERGI